MKRVVLSVIGFTFLSLAPVAAQWSGSVKADGAWNFKQSNNENADFKLKYTGRKFYVGSGIYFGHSYLPSVKTTTILDAKREKNEYYKGENNSIYPRKFNAGARIDFGYTFNPDNLLDASLSYGYSGKDENSVLKTDRYNNSNMSVLNGTQNDTAYVSSHNVVFSAAYNHRFASRPDAHLGVLISNMTKLDAEVNRRITSGNFYSKQKNYATYSSINDFDSILSAFYDDIFRFGKSDLKLKAGLDLISNQDLDGYFAETYVNGVWRDSTAYRQSYYYNSFSTEPYINLTWSVGKFDFFVKERVQVYWHAMMDKLEDIKKPEDIKGLFDKVDKEDFNYELGTSVDVFLNETTKLSSSLAYISAKQSAYNLKGEDIVSTTPMHRAALLGVNFAF